MRSGGWREKARQLVSKACGYGLTVAVSGIVSLVVIPFVIRTGGAGGWASVAVGQSLGSILNVFTYLGWLQTGPFEISRSDSVRRSRSYVESLWVRGVAWLILLPVAILLVSVVGAVDAFSAVVSAVAMMTLGLGASWFYVGEMEPMRLFLFDTLPRSSGMVVGVLVMRLWASVDVYVVLWLFGSLASVTLASADIMRRYPQASRRPPSRRRIGELIRLQKHGVLTAVLTTAYISLPLVLIQFVDSSAVAVFALADKIKQQALTATRPVAQVLQGWTPGKRGDDGLQRIRIAWLFSLLFGTMCGVSYVLLAPMLGAILGGDEVSISVDVAIPMGVSFGSAVITACAGVACLVPLGRQGWMTASAALGAVISIASVVPSVMYFHTAGAAWAVAFGQIVVMAVQASAIARGAR